MLEKKLREISNYLGGEKRDFFILTNKKYNREIYFTNEKPSISFIKSKFKTLGKRLMHKLIWSGILQVFLRKIQLSSRLGGVIFVAGQIKCFNLKDKTVLSFIKNEKERGPFLDSKKVQEKASKRGFAPKFLKLDKKFPYSEEKLLRPYEERDLVMPFGKLYAFYRENKIEKISSKKYAKKLSERIKNNHPLIMEAFKILNSSGEDLLIVTTHGDFAREQILLENNSCVFIDWNSHKGTIVEDLVNFFRTREIIENTPVERIPEFQKLLDIFPKEVKKNLKIYLIANELACLAEKRDDPKFIKDRLERLLTKSLNSN